MFEHHEGHVFYNGKLLVYTESERVVVSQNIRRQLDNKLTEVFDELLFSYRKENKHIEYIAGFEGYFNPARIVALIENGSVKAETAIKNYGLTTEEVNVGETFRAAQAAWGVAKERREELLRVITGKVGDRVKRPELPFKYNTDIENFADLFGRHAATVQRWMNHQTDDRLRFNGTEQESLGPLVNILRVSKCKKYVESIQRDQYRVGIKTCEAIFKAAHAKWLGEPYRRPRIRWNGNEQTFSIFDTSIKVGCQKIDRREVLRIGKEMGWVK